MHRNKSVDVHQFAMVPKAEIPRSSFRIQTTHKTTFDAGLLVPIYVDEVLPGDTFNVRMTAFARMTTPIFPLMDNLHMDTFFFFVPNRLVWNNWKKFMGEQDSPGDSTSYVIPQQVSPIGGYAVGSLQDHFGLPTVGQVGVGNTVSHSALPLRCYNLIWNEWFRDENLQTPRVVDKGDGPDANAAANYDLRRRGKRHDYFTSGLPWPQKGAAVSLPLGTTAPVISSGSGVPLFGVVGGNPQNTGLQVAVGAPTVNINASPDASAALQWKTTSLSADLSAATAATINQLRQSFQIQKLLERDARGGTRYTELVRAHFGVVSPDARLQRPEYLGGGSGFINVSPIAQTSGTAPPSGYTPTPMGTLAAIGTGVLNNHGFSQSFTEHGHVIGLVAIRADLTYQQGLRKFWSRSTRYDFYFPAFAMLGEQAILSKELFCDGSAADTTVFAYQERWAEYRYHPSMITGLFKSTSAGTIDAWHAAQRFVTRPVLNNDFIEDQPPISRLVAVGAQANGQQFLFDCFCDVKAARPMPMYSVPGLIDHF